jgi:hypothetical protein
MLRGILFARNFDANTIFRYLIHFFDIELSLSLSKSGPKCMGISFSRSFLRGDEVKMIFSSLMNAVDPSKTQFKVGLLLQGVDSAAAYPRTRTNVVTRTHNLCSPPTLLFLVPDFLNHHRWGGEKEKSCSRWLCRRLLGEAQLVALQRRPGWPSRWWYWVRWRVAWCSIEWICCVIRGWCYGKELLNFRRRLLIVSFIEMFLVKTRIYNIVRTEEGSYTWFTETTFVSKPQPLYRAPEPAETLAA